MQLQSTKFFNVIKVHGSIPAGCDCPVRLPDGARVGGRQERRRHLHRSAADDADAKTCTLDGTGELYRMIGLYYAT